MAQRWTHRFELKPGRWVYVPEEACRARGLSIKLQVEKIWRAPSYYFHLRQGGHLAALRQHSSSRFFIRCDINDFFGRIGRSRVTRVLKPLFSYINARDIANESLVRRPTDGAYMLPFGFVQSQLLASLCLEHSKLGRCLDRLHRRDDVKVSLYVDDIIVSSDDQEKLKQILALLSEAATASKFPFEPSKTEGPSALITAFNVEIARDLLLVAPNRLAKFRGAYLTATSEAQQQGIYGYVKSINEVQAAGLAS